MRSIVREMDKLNRRRAVESILDPNNNWQASKRLIQCTPVFGVNGAIAFWAVVLEGTPPIATIFVQSSWNEEISKVPKVNGQAPNGQVPPIFVDAHGKPKKLSKRSAKILSEVLTILSVQFAASEFLNEPCTFTIQHDGSVVRKLPVHN